MMFRSQSGPGGLSINTASANALSTSQASNAPPSGNVGAKSLFGSLSTNPTSQPQAGSSLFGNPATTQTQTGGGQQQSGGLFGNSNQQSGGLFGNSTQQQTNGQNANQNTTGAGGLFGLSQPAQQKSASLFGPSITVQQPQPTQSGGLFGGSLGQQPSQAPNMGLFGGSTLNTNKASAFGAPQTSSQPQQASVQLAPPSIFSSSIGQFTQQQQPVPGVRVSVNELRPTTRFNDLHEELQKAIEYVDNFILNKIHWKEQCDQLGGDIERITHTLPPDVEKSGKQLETLQSALENDAEAIAAGKSLVRADAADAKLSFKTVQSLKVPQHFQQNSLWGGSTQTQVPTSADLGLDTEAGGSRNLVEYFAKQTDNMSTTLETYKRNIQEVETYLRGVESNVIQQSQRVAVNQRQDGSSNINATAESQVRELAAVLRAFENGILGVAAKVGAAREMTQSAMLSGPEDPSAYQSRTTRRFGMR